MPRWERTGSTKTVQDRCVRSLEDRIRFLREELGRKGAILLTMAEKLPVPEPPRETPDETVEAGKEPESPTNARGLRSGAGGAG